MTKNIALGVGVVFLIVFLLSLFQNPIVGDGALFETNRAHDLVHLFSGILLILLGFSSDQAARTGFMILGFVYALVAILGFIFIPRGGMLLNFIEMSTADHWLHVVFAVSFLALGFSKKAIKA